MKKHNTKKQRKSLKRQAHCELKGMLRIGESKHEHKINGTAYLWIFSWGTYRTYLCKIMLFIKYILSTHPECTTLWSCRRYIEEYLKYREQLGLSPWTIHTDAKALGKLFRIRPGHYYYCKPPARHRKDIKKNRPCHGKKSSSSKEKYSDLEAVSKGTGQRTHELERTNPEYLYHRDRMRQEMTDLLKIPVQLLSKAQKRLMAALLEIQYQAQVEYYIYIPRGKGGRARFTPIIGPHAADIVALYQTSEPGKRLFPRIPSNVPIHRYRAEYAANLYLQYARPIAEIPFDCIHRGLGHAYQSQVYCCRSDMKGFRLDKRAMLAVAKSLGHNRICVFAYSYAWPLVNAMQEDPTNETLLQRIT